MSILSRLALITTLLLLPLTTKCFDLLTDYSGSTFFNGWDFYGSWDNLTLGDVWWLDEANATGSGIAYINDAGNAIIKVDNESYVPFNQKRNSVRITTQEAYTWGSVWVIDLLHIPYGCSVWPAFWSFGPDWPVGGEIDIIEAVNVMPNNQMALHTTSGCYHDPVPGSETGIPGSTTDCSPGSGCTVMEAQPNSYESGFAAAGGGVWATQFDVTGIYIWFWSRANIPASITSASSTTPLDISDFGTPSAAYLNSSTCNITNFFAPQNLVIDITLCGDWAGIGTTYNATCGDSGPTGLCYNDCVVGAGSPRYDEAYFEVSYVRVFTTSGAPAMTDTSAIMAPTTTMDPAVSTAASTSASDTSTTSAPDLGDSVHGTTVTTSTGGGGQTSQTSSASSRPTTLNPTPSAKGAARSLSPTTLFPVLFIPFTLFF